MAGYRIVVRLMLLPTGWLSAVLFSHQRRKGATIVVVDTCFLWLATHVVKLYIWPTSWYLIDNQFVLVFHYL